MKCLWCMKETGGERGWGNFLLLETRTSLCNTCSSQLSKLRGKRCSVCSRESFMNICSDCKRWQKREGNTLIFNHSIFHYNSFMKEVMAKWKYRGDYIVGEIFKPFIQTAWKEIPLTEKENLIIIPIPLSKERQFHRGFNQAEMLASFIPATIDTPMIRTHGEKQAKKNRKERIKAKNPFSLNKPVKKSVLLVDDIYTTGTTLRHAATALKKAGCPKVYALTLIRG